MKSIATIERITNVVIIRDRRMPFAYDWLVESLSFRRAGMKRHKYVPLLTGRRWPLERQDPVQDLRPIPLRLIVKRPHLARTPIHDRRHRAKNSRGLPPSLPPLPRQLRTEENTSHGCSLILGAPDADFAICPVRL